MKALSIDNLQDETVKRFEREAQVMGKLDHPGVVTLYGVGRTRGVPWLAMKHAGRHIRRGGVFLQFTSISAQQPTQATTPYSIFKSAVEQAIRIAAVEYGAKGIRYLGIAPGIVFTPMTAFINSDFTRKVIEQVTPLGRMVSIGDIVAAVRFLVSDSCFETGHIYPVTGGAAVTRALQPQEFFPTT